jgi:hypothetical protein
MVPNTGCPVRALLTDTLFYPSDRKKRGRGIPANEISVWA